MSHELRTPLNAILGFSEVMKSELFGPHAVPAYREYSNDIHGSGQHLLMLINEILDLSRVEAGRYELKEESVSIANVVDECRHLLSLRARDGGHHSGNWGGVLSNPATVIAHALATLVDARGRVLVEALRPPPLTDELRAALHGLRIGGGSDDPALSEGWGEPGLSPAERLVGWNTLEVLALGAGSPQRPVNAIPAEAVAHCQLRFVVGTPWERLEEIVRAHLAAHGFAQVEVAVTLSGAATRLPLDNPWVGWAMRSIAASAGQPPDLLPNLAGSLPNDIFARTLGLPTLWVPHSYPACAQHAPNEHLLAPVAREGLQLMAGLYWDLGEPAGVPWREGALH